MPEIKFIHDEQRATASRGRKGWTFTVDGALSLYWAPSEHAIRRVASRLLAGRSGEAFGGAGLITPGAVTVTSRGHDRPPRGKVLQAGEVTVETVTTKSGREKPREKRPVFVFELDGREPTATFASLAEAKVACATAAFMTRGRLGRFAEAEAAFKDQFGKVCKVHLLGRKIVAKDEAGGIWAVGLQEGHAPRFKLVVPPALN
jgi:hypothetical protein